MKRNLVARLFAALCISLTLAPMAHAGVIAPPAGAAIAALARDLDGAASGGFVKKATQSLASNTFYSLGAVTVSTNAFTGAAGPQPCPASLAAGQLYAGNAPSGSTAAATLNPCGLGTKSIKVVNSAGSILALVGGEIVTGPFLLYYDGTQFLCLTCAVSTRVAALTGAITLTQADFAAQVTLYNKSGASQIVTLPCSSTLSANGQINVVAENGAVTLQTSGGCTPTDAILMNTASATSVTVSTGAARRILTDGAGIFVASGT